MISTMFLSLNSKTKSELVNLFYNSAISFLLGGDWKKFFKEEKVKAIGAKKRFCEFWLTKTDAEMLRAIDVFLTTV